MAALCLLLGLASVADAQRPGQRPGFGFGFGGDWTGLLASEDVRKELGLVDEQVADLQKVREEFDAKRRELFSGAGNLRDLSEEERRQRFAELREKGSALAAEQRSKIEAVLLPKQVQRLKQISLQIRGAAALNDEEVAKELGLSDAQKEKLAQVQEQNRAKAQELFQGLRGGNREEFQQKMDQYRKESTEALLAVLTSEQRTKFEQMQGEKVSFDLSRLRGGFGFGGPGGRPGQPGARPGGPPGQRRPQQRNSDT
jgi:Spy/CpxP family protein refolding chaperone